MVAGRVARQAVAAIALAAHHFRSTGYSLEYAKIWVSKGHFFGDFWLLSSVDISGLDL